jgi:hypothetical protein
MSVTQDDRDYVRDQLKVLADLLNDMVEVEALREGLTVEEWERKAEQEIARQRVRLTGKKLAIAKAMYADPAYSIEDICHTLNISALTLSQALKA